MSEPLSTHDADTTAIARWLAAAEADADQRGLPELKPLLQGLAASTAALRAADWNDRTDDAPSPASRLADRP
jgi:hypothetical protein